MPRTRPHGRDDFGVAIICALPLEYDAVSYIFDEFWDEDGDHYGRAIGDPNSYTTGRIGDFNVVLALLPHMGRANAASAAASMRSSYAQLRLALLVGVCGGAPRLEQGEVFLGDVVISQMVVQYDFGRQYPDKFLRKDTVQDSLGRPNKDIRNLVATFQTDRGQDKLQDRVNHFLHQLQSKVNDTRRRGKYDYPGMQEDQLFAPQHRHKHHLLSTCICQNCLSSSDPVCEEARSAPCADLGCGGGDPSVLDRVRSHTHLGQTITPPQANTHVGVIASGDLVLKSAIDRERIYQETKAIAFEMEGAGVWDEHKGWQNYAAATAAAASKAVLERYIRTDRAGVAQELGTAATTADSRGNILSPAVFHAPISGHNVIAGTTVTGGTTTFDFRS